jgi:hypothetical protein
VTDELSDQHLDDSEALRVHDCIQVQYAAPKMVTNERGLAYARQEGEVWVDEPEAAGQRINCIMHYIVGHRSP